jgi:DNA-binding CsgD family transcriptional regulator
MTDSGNRDHKQWQTGDKGGVTPRQVEVLALASAGLSDEEIGARLKLSARAVRFHFEKLFEKFGVRDRAEAVTIWSGSRRRTWKADRCPYPKPFPEGFTECPAYRAMLVATLDMRDRPTASIWTCANLTARLNPRTEESWYPGCAIGSPADRERWAAEVVGPDRLEAMNELAGEIAAITWPAVERLWQLKQEQRAEIQQGRDGSQPTRELEGVRDRLMARLQALLSQRRELLDRNQLSARACLDIAQRAINGLLPAHVAADWNARLDVLLALPEEAWPTAA